MSTKLNAEELAVKRYPNPTAMIPQPDGTFLNINHSATAYAAAIREVAQPLADERDELRDALRDLLEAMSSPVHNDDDAAGAIGDVYATIDHARAILSKYPKP